jgi:hypothetical protein
MYFYQGLSDDGINLLIEKQLQPIWKAFKDSMKDRAEMKFKLDALESSENNLKNRVEDLKNEIGKLQD